MGTNFYETSEIYLYQKIIPSDIIHKTFECTNIYRNLQKKSWIYFNWLKYFSSPYKKVQQHKIN